ncbi:MAG: site-specific integrase [Actinomycetota bacterium]|nr:site-specific integrase [Actinomycetota bacterium]
MAGARSVKRTRFPGIYRITTPGKPDRFMVSYRVRGLGQRTKTKPTLREAKEFQASVRDPLKARQLRQLEQGRITLAEYFPLFLERRRNLSPSTRARYESVGRLHIIPGRLGQLPVASITRDDVEGWITDLEKKGVGVGSIDKAYRTLRALLTSALLEGKTLSNPATRIVIPRGPVRDAFFLTADEVDLIANNVPVRHRALVYLLAYTGLRIGEASALRVRHLDLLDRALTVSESSAEVGGRKLSGQTKTRRVRTVELSQELCTELAQHLEKFGPRTEAGDLDPNGWVFTHAQKGQIRQNNWRARVFQPACVRAGVVRLNAEGDREPPRVHDLRHTAASLAAHAGYTLHEVKDMLGHTTIKTTSDLYLHLFKDTKRQKAESLGELMARSRADRGQVVGLSQTSEVK